MRVFADHASLFAALADDFLNGLTAAADAGRRFVAALSGGGTPRPLYARLGRELGAPWSALHVLMVDERDVPDHSDDSNLGPLRRLWLDPVALAESQIHAPPVPASDLESAARQYEATLLQLAGNPPQIDWVLLGIGNDGHTASLFPGSEALLVRDRYVLAVLDSAKPPPRRLTLSLPTLFKAASVHVVALGAQKALAVRRALEDGDDSERLPLRALARGRTGVCWWLDQAAAASVSLDVTRRGWQ